MNLSTEESESAKCRASRRVAERREEVQSFFSDNWSRLRSLIMHMEEQAWQHDGPTERTAKKPLLVSGESARVVIDDSREPAASEERLSDDFGGGSTDRLAELARQIDQRIRINLAQRK